ncbi:velvet factor-domain-containing protein [Pisolithus croceorrhizus]|nr:velvet factor-domain-containing protein [Pisolithus croceorrhizus]
MTSGLLVLPGHSSTHLDSFRDTLDLPLIPVGAPPSDHAEGELSHQPPRALRVAVTPVALPQWSQWSGHYSLEVVQNPIRARMCGFGDKDRRPLAPAVVAKMIVRREDNSIVDVDEVDCSFFLVTVDLWSADGSREMNLVLHPSSTSDRYVPVGANKSKQHRGSNPSMSSPRSDHPSPSSSHSTPTSATEPSRIPMDAQLTRFWAVPRRRLGTTIQITRTQLEAHPYLIPPVIPGQVRSPPLLILQVDGVTHTQLPLGKWIAPTSRIPCFVALQETACKRSPRQNPGMGQTGFRTDHDTGNFRSWSAVADPSYGLPAPSQGSVYGNQEVDSTTRSHPPVDADQGRYPQEPYSVAGQGYDNPPVYSSPIHPNQSPQTTYYQHSYSQSTSSSSSPASAHSLPRHTYTRTLVGPLSSNACRLLDEHRRPGIFFLFQDLSVRTEGKFRLRLRLMNVGDSPTPGLGATRVHTAASPVLAQAFTETFTVYSAKRFPGVPDTTPLSIAFGNQGQKLPLRNRHGTGSGQSRKMHQGESGDSDESDDTR